LADKKAISYFHCTLFIDNESIYLRDDNSRNGTFVNRRRIQPGTKVQVCDGDSIMLADTTFTLKIIAQISKPAEPRNPRVISFCSVEGGAGKTTLSLSLARALYQAGYAVLYVDAENMNTFQVDIHYQEYASSDFLKSMRSYENMSFRLLSKHFGKVGFSIFPPVYGSLEMQEIDLYAYLAAIQLASVSGMYDYILVESDSCCNNVNTELFSISDQVFLVHKGTDESKQKTRMLGLLVDLNNQRFVQVENSEKAYCTRSNGYLPTESPIIKKMVSTVLQ
jgi:cellulose biosynthesis protein BcsQ